MKTYIPKSQCKAINGNFGEFYNISFKVEELVKLQNDKGFVNLTLSKKREADQYGNTHYFTLNDWKPEGEVKNEELPGDISIDSIPF